MIQFVAEMEMGRCGNDASLLDDSILLEPKHLTPSSVADLYLLAVAVANNASLATFDRRINPAAIKSGKNSLELISIAST
ncbi:hypothetical protein HZ994_17140 [Akkermansiaceae bacterium]|nr:hypothetical protein HZ994_17140 [Akkermansiaceae bacterium]